MARKISIDDVYELRQIGLNRLHPRRTPLFLWGALLFALILNGGTLLGIFNEVYMASVNWHKVANIIIILLSVQGFGTLFFQNRHAIYQFQKLHAIWLCLVAYKLPVDLYLFYFFITDSSDFPTEKHLLGLYLLVGGLLLTIACTIYGFGRIRKGCFREGGKLLYNFQQSKGAVSFPLMFAVASMGGWIGRHSVNQISAEWHTYIFLFLCVSLHYLIAMAWPEFVLLAYCKFRFKEFILPKAFVHKSIWHWFTRPINLQKSLTGWKLPERAPARAILVAVVQFTLLYIVLIGLVSWLANGYIAAQEYMYIIIVGIIFMIPSLGLSLLLFWLVRVILKK